MEPQRRRRRNHIANLLSLIAMFASLAFPPAAFANVDWRCDSSVCGSCGFIHCKTQCTAGSEQSACNDFCPPCAHNPTFCEHYPDCPGEGDNAETCVCS
jgi:hypothetical protein